MNRTLHIKRASISPVEGVRITESTVAVWIDIDTITTITINTSTKINGTYVLLLHTGEHYNNSYILMRDVNPERLNLMAKELIAHIRGKTDITIHPDGRITQTMEGQP